MLYIAEPPLGVPLGALLSQAASQALGSPFPLPLDPLFSQESHALSSILFPNSGAYAQEVNACSPSSFKAVRARWCLCEA